jgi:hypothetical protein
LSGNRCGGLPLDGDDVRATDHEPSDGPAQEVAMSSKSPATAPSGAKITTADVEAAERARITDAALRLQQATVGPPPPTPEQERAVRLLDRLEARPTSEDVANAQVRARLQDVSRRNAQGAEASRAYAARLRAGGYQGWTGGQR